MQLEVGNIVEGKVTGITKFGAFVELPGGQTGMVHISEVSFEYVKEITDYLSDGQMVKVKVLTISPEGKVGLSMKKCEENKPKPQPVERRPDSPPPIAARPKRTGGGANRGWQPKKTINKNEMSFEDMMAHFKQSSDDKMSDLKRSGDYRKTSRRGSK